MTAADDFIKDPYVLDFLDLGGRTDFDEHQLEQALMTRLQEFMLELGRGFAFVGRQYRLDGEQASYYVDLVFYNIKLKCYVLIELCHVPAHRGGADRCSRAHAPRNRGGPSGAR